MYDTSKLLDYVMDLPPVQDTSHFFHREVGDEDQLPATCAREAGKENG